MTTQEEETIGWHSVIQFFLLVLPVLSVVSTLFPPQGIKFGLGLLLLMIGLSLITAIMGVLMHGSFEATGYPVAFAVILRPIWVTVIAGTIGGIILANFTLPIFLAVIAIGYTFGHVIYGGKISDIWRR